MNKATNRKIKKLPFREREGLIKFLPDILQLLGFSYGFYLTYNLDNKIASILCVCYILLYLFRILGVAQSDQIRKENELNTNIEETEKKDRIEIRTIWSNTLVKVAELSVIAYIILNLARHTIPIIFHIGSVDAWIGFSGSIISGIITMMALLYTIMHEAKIRDEDKIQKKIELGLQFMPIIELSFESDGQTGYGLTSQGEHDDEVESYVAQASITLNFNNTSPFIARALSFTSFDVEQLHQSGFEDVFVYNRSDFLSKKYSLKTEANECIQNIKLIPGNGKSRTTITIPIYEGKLDGLYINCLLEYFDYNKAIKHSVLVEGNFSITFEEVTQSHVYLDNVDVLQEKSKFIKLEYYSGSYSFID